MMNLAGRLSAGCCCKKHCRVSFPGENQHNWEDSKFPGSLYEPANLARHGDERQNAVSQALVISDSLIDQTCGAESWDKSLSKRGYTKLKSATSVTLISFQG
jgi:hypothetical protein